MTLNMYHVLRYALRCTKFKLTSSYPFTKCNDYFEANLFCDPMTLTFVPFILKVCGRSGVIRGQLVIVCSKFDRNRTTPAELLII